MAEVLDVEWPRARAWLESVRRAAARIEALSRELADLEDAREQVEPWSPRGCGGAKSVHSDPTAAEAERRMGELDALICGTRARIVASEDVVGECLRVLSRMRDALGDDYTDMIELYYVDRRAQTWSEVADEMGLSVSTVYRMRMDAYAWIEKRCKGILA